MKKLLISVVLAVSASANAASNPPVIDTREQVPQAKEDVIESKILIKDGWVRVPTATSKNTAGYFLLENTTGMDITLIEVKTIKKISERVEIHGYKPDDAGVKKMFKLESVTIPNNSSVEFKPGSFHVMLMGLEKPFISAGDKIDFVFKFRPASDDSKVVFADKVIEFIAK